MQAVCENDIKKLEKCLQEGWINHINDVIDSEGKFNALSLACHLDHLEVVHTLDLHGADLNSGVGKFKNTALMASVMKWNVRVIDYLMERGADPFIKDKFGFTAKRKAEIKQLRTIHRMLDGYEKKYLARTQSFQKSAITNEVWASKLKNAAIDYRRVKLMQEHNNVTRFLPSQLKMPGEYPFSNF